MTTLDIRKQIIDPREEKLFYNPISQGRYEQTPKVTNLCETPGVFTCGHPQVLDEVELKKTTTVRIADILLIYSIALVYGI